MSPVFGHGRLRLYLLKLLEESPRHGYEVIRLLQDRFLGVYSPSPGTIYPRLARLEEEGLVTHEVVDGKKVFTLTDKGRRELNDRMDELAELEQEITASVQDIAREVKEDVRQTVRSLRHELTQMARDINKDAARENRDAWREQKEEWRRQRQQAKDTLRQQKEEWRHHKERLREETERWQRDWRRIWEETWSLTGQPPQRDGGPVHDAELGRLLADFVAEIRREASEGGVTEASLTQCRAVLDEAAQRIRDTLRP
ncbi:helix-turn-helix transcriptional regulator [Planotetraspora sp. A-T 1434]|uniref:PadR family transcriptional regulator n=1 Tax=Planotetraspora sp. A-T 1434 TaxID=2979219 RepID=UPI0021C02036|nr:helix-turn-helix transcriptional regulator [Planotetraspora sp. A-T 1434]MCT9931278.1 helix-turn-helix transcriptional regulator [Planotetraspora sp. A-T 1434]